MNREQSQPMDTNPNNPQGPQPQNPENSGPIQPGQQPAPTGWERPQQPPQQSNPQQPAPQRLGTPPDPAQQTGRHSQPEPGTDATVPLPTSPQQTTPMNAATPPPAQRGPVGPGPGPVGPGPGGPGGPTGPGGPAGPVNVGPSQPPAQRSQKSKSKIIGLSAAGLVAVLVILLVGSELYFRNSVQSCLGENIKNGTKANDVSVSLSKKPMILQATGKLPSIDIQATGLNATEGLNAHILLKGVEPSGDNRVDDATIQGTFTADGIKNKVSQTGVLSNPTVNLNTSANQIEITGTAIIVPITINLKPTLQDNKVVLTASKASVMGVGVPDDLAQQLITAIADIPTPQGLTASDLKMTDQGVSVTYTGKNVLPKDIESSGDTGAVSCSVI